MSDSVGRTLLRFAPAIYGPTALFSIGEGAVIPLLPVLATHLGANVALATLIAALVVIGQLLGNLPAGWAVARFGERPAMAVSAVASLVAAAGIALAPTLWVLAVSTLVLGLGASVFNLARHAFLTVHVPVEIRARALAVLAGTFRLGSFAGPFIAAGLLALTGTSTSAAWFTAGCLLLTAAFVLLSRDPSESAFAGGGGVAVSAAPADTEPTPGVFAAMWQNRGVLARLGSSAATLAALRSARQVLLPVWGIAIGADPGSIALVVGLSGACDFALFYASGQVTDRFGRLWAVVPAMFFMSGALILLSFTEHLDTAFGWYATVAALLGIGNGLTSGLLLTLGSDLAPAGNPAAFLGSWHTMCDAGSAIAPVAIAGVAAFSLPLAAALMGALGLYGGWGFLRWIPRYVPRRK